MNFFYLMAADDGVARTVFEWGRIRSNSDWIAPIAVAVLLVLVTRIIHRRDTRELRPATAWSLTILRAMVVLALLVFYLQPQWRREEERRVNSKAILLIDRSLSMGIVDGPDIDASRSDQVAKSLGRARLVERLRERHDVEVFGFGENVEPLLSSPTRRFDVARGITPEGKADSSNVDRVDWPKVLAPRDPGTRLGDALGQLLDQHRDVPVSGIILITDGGQNAGTPPESVLPAARRARIPILAVGVGSDQGVANVRVSDFVVPARAFPGDQYAVTGYLQASGMAGQVVTVELHERSADVDAASGDGELIESREVVLGDDGEVLPVRFELAPKEPGRRTLALNVETPATDRSPADNRREADVEIVDRKSRILLLAGGPTRDYQFLRGLLHRDPSVVVDVLLQSGRPGISQEANRLLDDFPATREELYQYDCVIAFDPDWRALSDEQTGLLESWVAEQGGGLIVTAGAVNMGNPIRGWIQDERMGKIRSLYPVTFERRFVGSRDTYSSTDPWPLDFTREGIEAEFLWLLDDMATSQRAWAQFPGVYSYYPVEGAKPGATVLARFSDPRVGSEERRPVYAAVQFYGSGRVLYLGSAEMWRLRMIDEAHFETLYTKMARHVSQGRLLRGSSRGVLLVDRDRYMLGGTVEIRAQLTDARLEPLATESVPLQVVEPSGALRTVGLQSDPARVGMFAGRFVALEEGVYRLELPIPDSDQERLSRRIQVRMPDLERENPRRNDELLAKMATATGGRYYAGTEMAFPEGSGSEIVEQLKDRTKTIILSIGPSRDWQRNWLRWFMLIACGLLFAEWLIRRLVKLA